MKILKTMIRKNNICRLLVIVTLFIITTSIFLAAAGCSSRATVILYFAKYEDTFNYLVPETREVIKDDDLYKTVLEEIIRGPQDEQLYPTLPSSVKVNSVKIEDGVAIADFSKELLTDTSEIPHSSSTEVLAVFSIVDTLTEFDEIQKVRITIEGKQDGQIDGLYIEDFWGHIGIYEDFSRNEDILEKSLN